MSNPKIVSVHNGSLIQVSFPDGLEKPIFRIEGLHIDGDGEKYSHVAFLKACAKLLNDKAESLEIEFEQHSSNVTHQVD